MRDEIIKIAKENLADIVGFASAESFDKTILFLKFFPIQKRL